MLCPNVVRKSERRTIHSSRSGHELANDELARVSELLLELVTPQPARNRVPPARERGSWRRPGVVFQL